MNDQLLAKKLGEVQAFAVIGLELLERGGEAAAQAFPVDDMCRQLHQQLEAVRGRADQTKAERTTQKLRAMMEHYISDEWDNPTELLEWSGFYFGAAAVHWDLVASLWVDQQAFAAGQAACFAGWLTTARQTISQA